MEGKKKKKVICIACSCVFAIVEKVIPTIKFAIIKGKVTTSSNSTLPKIGMENKTFAAKTMSNN